MNALATLLQAPLDWRTAATNADMRNLLDDLQANILKGHGRLFSGHVFIGFAGMAAGDIAEVIRTLAQHLTSAHEQLRTNKRFAPHLDAGTVRCMFLSASGYRALGALAQMPAGDAFGSGMAARGALLHDPDRAGWSEVGWSRTPPDAMMLVANADIDTVTHELEAIERWLGGTGAKVLFVERGLQQQRSFRAGEKPEGVEHFGYVDGRSQPLVLTEDLTEPHDHWQSAFPPAQFVVADPNGRSPLSAGSYFVFRKLEQDALGFNAAERALARVLFGDTLTKTQSDRAGAMVVGRFEDGTPLVLEDGERRQAVPNDFNYDADPDGLRCPFHAHIRKTNPRGDVRRALKLSNDDADRGPIMIRRGITYGAERPKNADGSEFDDAGHEPTHFSGLLFQAYMASIEQQFEFVQRSWANAPRFAGNLDPAVQRFPTGIDPVIGQSSNETEHLHEYRDGWTAGAEPVEFNFSEFVKMKGGEYFFAPSLSFLRGVGL